MRNAAGDEKIRVSISQIISLEVLSSIYCYYLHTHPWTLLQSYLQSTVQGLHRILIIRPTQLTKKSLSFIEPEGSISYSQTPNKRLIVQSIIHLQVLLL
jgi:hypothetical protein